METRSRKRAQAMAHRSSAGREEKKPNLAEPPGPATSQHRYPSRRTRPIVAEDNVQVNTTTILEPSAPSTRSKKKRVAEVLPVQEPPAEVPKPSIALKSPDRGKEKDSQLESRGKGKEKEVVLLNKDSNHPSSLVDEKMDKKTVVKNVFKDHDLLLPSHDTIMHILSTLTSGDEEWQLQGLTQLCEMLCMGNEHSLANLPARTFVMELVNILTFDHNPELMLLAARALTQLCDALPSSCNLLVHQGAIPLFCKILQSIQYIDVAEQALQALLKISREYPGPCVRAGGLLAVLSNFEFFSTGVQRVAVSTAANMCKRLPTDTFESVKEAIPILTNLLQYPDTKVVEYTSLCFMRLAESFALSAEKLDTLCSHGLIPETVRLIAVDNTGGVDTASQSSLSNSTYTGLVRLLSICASGSAMAVESLLVMNISSILRDIMAGSGHTSGHSLSSSVMNMPPEQLSEIVNLVNVLLPPMPPCTIPVNLPQSETLRLFINNVATRKQPLCEHPSLLSRFGTDLFSVIVQVYGTSVTTTIRYTCLDVIHKLVHFSTGDMLEPIFGELNISSFLVGVLATKDATTQVTGLRIADLLMQKLHSYFAKMFVKEGVLHTISKQFGVDLSNTGSPTDRSTRRSKQVYSQDASPKVSSAKVASSPMESLETGSGHVEVSKQDLPSLAVMLAQNFKGAYFRSSSSTSVSSTFKRLKKLGLTLSGDAKQKGKNSEAASATSDDVMAAALVEILNELGSGDSVSTFEFVGCGIVESLLNYFSCGNLQHDRMPSVELRQKALERLQLFFKVAMSCNGESSEPLLVMIIRKLQSALASLESFPLSLTRVPPGSSHRTIGLNALSHPLKLQFARSPGEKHLRDFPPPVVLVSPLTSLSSLEEYLWPNVRVANTPLVMAPWSISAAPSAVEGKPSTRAQVNAPPTLDGGRNLDADGHTKAASTSKGKEKVDASQERRGVETRSLAERRRQVAAATIELLSEAEDEEDTEHYSTEAEEMYATDDEDVYYSDEDRYEHGQIQLVSEEEYTLVDVHEVWLDDEGPQTIDQRLAQRAPAGSASPSARFLEASASGRVLEASMDSVVMVPSASSLSKPERLCFMVDGKLCDRSWTLLKAIQNVAMAGERGISFYHERWLWDRVHTMHYEQPHHGTNAETSRLSKRSCTIGNATDKVSHRMFLLDSIVHKQLPCSLDTSSPTYNILLLLYILEGLNRLTPSFHARAEADVSGDRDQEAMARGLAVPVEEFLSSKLMSKLIQQMQDVVALCSGNMPTWCDQLIRACAFLFTFDSRRQYFYLTAFGLLRAFHRLQQQQPPNTSNGKETQFRLGRRKVRIFRDRVFESALKVMDRFSNDKGVLEVEYFGECGTGLGPTLEFFTLLSRELQKASLGMWRCSPASEGMDDDNLVQGDGSRHELVCSSYGLFPRPMQRDSPHYATVVKYFRLLGQVVGKALQDGRLLDLPLSKAFYTLMLEQELDLHDLKLIDMELGSSLEEMYKLVEARRRCKFLKRKALRFHNTRIEELCLNFTLPGYPEYLLKPGGENIMVNSQNLEEYITLIVDASLKTGISAQMEAFRAGFNQIFPVSSIQIFNEEELSYMLCGHREMWQPETLVEHLRFDHGYNASSQPIRHLLEIMGEFNPEQQRAFVQFVTGAPQLPCGGLAALRPKLTIVCKHPNGANGESSPGTYSLCADGDLPSVMTCANYLKLPPYSCKEVMLERLLYAIHEGQGSFNLS